MVPDENTRWLFVLNPAAGAGKSLRAWHSLEPLLLSKGIMHTMMMSSPEGGVTAVIREQASMGWDHITVLGGDGTMHEAVNGILASTVANRIPILSLLPCGSGNDWARYWRIPRDPHRWLAGIARWPVHKHNAGIATYMDEKTLQSRYFINSAGLGYDGLVVQRIADRPGGKGHPFIYMLEILRTLFLYRPALATVSGPDVQHRMPLYTVIAGVCPFSGGGMRLVPHALHDSPTLAVTVARHMSLPKLFANMWRFYTGSIGRVNGVWLYKLEDLKVTPEAPGTWIQADGELLGQGWASFRIIPDAFQIKAPPRVS